ncbi:hypothetical protein EYF80_024539 [Liparis tanakae]|uniref:Uncharacterized protein n=1 Tax=Liparis tanakae TaxID=230148 RepID=A0A4Z2HI96_9TELE|nr:hypothetical protein EYF80_024539 [Liparis tanakae]
MEKASCSSLISFSRFSSRNTTRESLMSTTSIICWRTRSSSACCSDLEKPQNNKTQDELRVPPETLTWAVRSRCNSLVLARRSSVLIFINSIFSAIAGPPGFGGLGPPAVAEEEEHEEDPPGVSESESALRL